MRMNITLTITKTTKHHIICNSECLKPEEILFGLQFYTLTIFHIGRLAVRSFDTFSAHFST